MELILFLPNKSKEIISHINSILDKGWPKSDYEKSLPEGWLVFNPKKGLETIKEK